MNAKELVNIVLNSNDYKERDNAGLILSKLYSPGEKENENEKIATDFFIWAYKKLEVIYTTDYIEDSLLDRFDYATISHFNLKKYLIDFIKQDDEVYISYHMPNCGDSHILSQFVKFVSDEKFII